MAYGIKYLVPPGGRACVIEGRQSWDQVSLVYRGLSYQIGNGYKRASLGLQGVVFGVTGVIFLFRFWVMLKGLVSSCIVIMNPVHGCLWF